MQAKLLSPIISQRRLLLAVNTTAGITGDKTLTVTGNTTIGNGSLTLSSGTISNAIGTIGNSVGSNGSITVNGGNWTNSGAIRVGEAGNGTLLISEGTVSTNSTLAIGRLATGSGTVSISGGNLSVTSSLTVGASGTGELVISGGNMTNATALVAQSPTGLATITVSGGTWSNQILSIGYAGKGNLLVDGGSVSATLARIGELSGSEGTITVSSGSLSTSSDVIVGEAGSGILTIAGTGEVSVNSGNRTVIIAEDSGSTGTLNIGIFGNDSEDPAGTLNTAEVKGGRGTATLNFNQGGNKFAPKITGRTSVNVLGDGGITTLTSTQNTYTGTTTISSERGLRIGDGGANGSIGTGNIINNGSLQFRSSLDLTLANTISGSGGVQQRGSGTTTLRGNSSYTGSTEVRTGTLKIMGGGKVEGTGQIHVYGGEGTTLTVDGSGGGGLITATSDLFVGKGEFGTLNVLNGGVFTAQYGYLGEAINGTSVVTVDGAGSTLTFVDGAAMAFQGKEETTSVLTVTNGGTVNTAELLVNADEGDGDDSTTATLTIASGGVVNVGTGTGVVGVGSDNDGGAGIVNIGTFGGNSTAGTLNASEIKGGGDSATLNFNQTNAIDFAPKITGSTSVNQLGSGTTNLSADSTYTGTTTVSAGTLYVYGNNAAATGDVTVQNGGKLGGTGTIGGNVTIQSGGTITTSPELPDTLTTSNLTLQDGSTALFRFGSTSNYDAIVGLPGSTVTASGNVTLSLQLPFSYSGNAGDTFKIFDSFIYDLDAVTFNVTSNLGSQFKWDLSNLKSKGEVKIAFPISAPTVTGISPNSGSISGGTSVTITGTDFTGATGVTIGGTAATNVNVVNATTITCTTPSGVVGTASVVVTTPGGSNAANTLFTYEGLADLELTLTSSPNPVLASENLTYTLSLTNNGPSTALNPTVSLPLPAALTFVSAIVSDGWQVSNPAVGAGGTVTFSHSSLSSGATVTFTVVAKVISSAPTGTVINAAASAAATSTDPVDSNDSDTFQAAVGTVNPTALQLSGIGVINRQNGLFDFTVNVTNTTPFPINGFRLRVDIATYLAAYPSLRLYNATSAQGSSDVFVDFPYPVAVNGVVPVSLSFYTNTRTFPNPFTPSYSVEILPSSAVSGTNGSGVQPRIELLQNGNVLLEFPSVPGLWYRVRYSHDLTNWFDSPVPIQASNNRMQWIDSGAPLTSGPPSSVPSRYYRVNQIMVAPPP